MKRALKIFNFFFMLFFVLILVWFQFPFIFTPSQYLLFMHRGHNYYTNIAEGCNSILATHNVTSNDVVRFTSQAMLPYAIKINGDDNSLPRVIKRLGPKFVLVMTNSVVVSIPPERMGGFGIVWTRLDTNHWTMQTEGDGLMKTVARE